MTRPNADQFMHQNASDPRFCSFPGSFAALPATLPVATRQAGMHTIWAGI